MVNEGPNPLEDGHANNKCSNSDQHRSSDLPTSFANHLPNNPLQISMILPSSFGKEDTRPTSDAASLLSSTAFCISGTSSFFCIFSASLHAAWSPVEHLIAKSTRD